VVVLHDVNSVQVFTFLVCQIGTKNKFHVMFQDHSKYSFFWCLFTGIAP